MSFRGVPVLIAAVVALWGCAAAPRPPGGGAAEAAAPGSVVLLGSFHIIWNGRPHYLVTDAGGTTTELLMTEEQTRTLGGPLQLNGKRVRVTGERVTEPRGGLRVTSIDLQP